MDSTDRLLTPDEKIATLKDCTKSVTKGGRPLTDGEIEAILLMAQDRKTWAIAYEFYNKRVIARIDAFVRMLSECGEDTKTLANGYIKLTQTLKQDIERQVFEPEF